MASSITNFLKSYANLPTGVKTDFLKVVNKYNASDAPSIPPHTEFLKDTKLIFGEDHESVQHELSTLMSTIEVSKLAVAVEADNDKLINCANTEEIEETPEIETDLISNDPQTTQASLSAPIRQRDILYTGNMVYPIYVGKLSTDTTEQELTSAFEALGLEVVSVSMPTTHKAEDNAATANNQLVRKKYKYGFVNFKTMDDLRLVLKSSCVAPTFHNEKCTINACVSNSTLYIGKIENIASNDELYAELQSVLRARNIEDNIIGFIDLKKNYAFVTFTARHTADKVRKSHMLDPISLKSTIVSINWAEDDSASEKDPFTKTLFVHNITIGTKHEEISDLASQYGKVLKVNIVPNKTYAFIEFLERSSALKAFVAFKNYQLNGALLGANMSVSKTGSSNIMNNTIMNNSKGGAIHYPNANSMNNMPFQQLPANGFYPPQGQLMMNPNMMMMQQQQQQLAYAHAYQGMINTMQPPTSMPMGGIIRNQKNGYYPVNPPFIPQPIPTGVMPMPYGMMPFNPMQMQGYYPAPANYMPAKQMQPNPPSLELPNPAAKRVKRNNPNGDSNNAD